MGRPTEFITTPNAGLKQEQITLPHPALVTDDTQMSLIVAEAAAGRASESEIIERAAAGFLHWHRSDDHEGRAPGNTCRDAMEHYGQEEELLAQNYSKGSGGIMRTHPLGFVSDQSARLRLSTSISRITHGHPTSTLASATWTEVVAAAVAGVRPLDWMDVAWNSIALVRRTEDATGRGTTEVRESLAMTELALMNWDRIEDPCLRIGPGWTAEDALGVALLVAITYENEPEEAVKRAARTSGDSDTIASMVGALLGAYHGMDAWNINWENAVERPFLLRIRAATPPAL